MERQFKLVVYVPTSHADAVRDALSDAGAGVIGNYTHCSFTMTGIGRFRPEEGARPYTGSVGKVEEVEEERIETVCRGEVLHDVIDAVKRVHPYEEPAIDAYPIEIL